LCQSITNQSSLKIFIYEYDILIFEIKKIKKEVDKKLKIVKRKKVKGKCGVCGGEVERVMFRDKSVLDRCVKCGYIVEWGLSEEDWDW